MDNNQMQGQGSGGPQRPDGQRQPDQNGRNKNNGKKPNSGKSILVFLVITLVVMLISNVVTSMVKDTTEREITYNQFINMVERGEVESVEISSSRIDINLKNQPIPGVKITCYTGIMDDPDLTDRLLQAGVQCTKKVPDNSSYLILNIVANILPLVMIGFIFYFFMRRMGSGGGVMGVGKSKAKVYGEKETGVTFQDVAGQDEAKESLQEVVGFLEDPQKYVKIGAKLPKGALLVGPPGTGKTLLAKAVAGEAHVPFFSISGSDFVEMFVGVGASRVRDLFEEAKKSAPCIIFIDEIDAIGKSRDSRYGGGNDEREQTLNQLLAEMDGFDSSKGVLILAATNRPEVLDSALLRPGRFDRRVIVDRPDLKGREDILRVHAKNVNLDETVNFKEIALATAGAVGSDLANMVNEAAILAVKAGRSAVSQADLSEAVELVEMGKEKKNKILSKKEREIVSYHEVGHALVSALQKDAEPVQKITIVPRTMGALGYTLQTPEEEKYLQTKDELLAKITTYMAGRAAEMLVFGSATSGAANDIESATSIARAMVTQYGMSDKFGMMCLATVENQYLDNRAGLICGEETAAQIDQEVLSIINSSYDEAYRMLEENREVLDKISGYLYEHETITGKEFMKIFRELKGIPEPEEEEKKTFFEQAEDAKNALEQAKTEEHAKTEGQTEIKNQAEAETSRAAEDQNTVSLEKGSFIDQVVDDQTAAHEEHQK